MFNRRKSEPRSGQSAAPSGDRTATGAARAGSNPADPADGPHDRSEVADPAAMFAAAGMGHVDLGSLVIGIPPGREINVAMSPTGAPEFHLVSQVARVIPTAYAAPKSAGQWRSWVTELRTALEQQGAQVSIEDGPWGRELAASLPGALFRVIGADGPRWMLEMRVVSTPENAAAAADEGREVFGHLIVDRGQGPMPAREPLPVEIPEEIQQALAQAQQQMAEDARQNALAEQMAVADGQAPAADAEQQRRSGRAMDALREREL